MAARSTRIRRTVVQVATAAVASCLLVLTVSPPALAAAAPEQLVCSGGGAITIDHTNGLYHWVLSGIGSCTMPDHPAQVRQVSLAGTAATTTLGLCSGDAFVDAFSMNVDATFVSLSTAQAPISTLQKQIWSVPAATYPIVTGFGITDINGGDLGTGELETHIFAQCPPDGQPTMQVNWVQAA